jgi:hypothetical protein
VCGTANESTRSFCLNCGSKLPKQGTTGRLAAAAVAGRNDRPGSRTALYALGGILLFVVAAAIAFVALGGLGSRGPSVSGGSVASPANRTFVALAPSGSGGAFGSGVPAGASAVAPIPSASGALVATPRASDLPESQPPLTPAPPTAPPASLPIGSSGLQTLPPLGQFVCAPTQLTAAAPGGWRISQIRSGRGSGSDLLAIALTQRNGPTSNASVAATLMPLDQVLPTLGVPAPTGGDNALVLLFNESVSAGADFGIDIGYTALHDASVVRHGGFVYVVVGVNGTGCYNMTSTGWTSGATGPTELDVVIQR